MDIPLQRIFGLGSEKGFGLSVLIVIAHHKQSRLAKKLYSYYNGLKLQVQ